MNTNIKKYLLLSSIALTSGVVGAGVVKWMDNTEVVNTNVQSSPIRFTNFTSDGVEHPNFVSASAIATPAVVHIKVKLGANSSTSSQQNPNADIPDSFRELFGDRGFHFNQPNQPQAASGSGVIVSQDGYIVTNNHVVDGANEIEVVLNDKRSFDGKIIGTDPSTDLALVKINAKDLAFLKYGNSDGVNVGEWVLAVGNPFNLTSTVTAGIVSAKARSINILGGKANIESFIQTDAAVNPGNSGGALVNTNGDLIGINTAIASETGSYSGYSFAVPSNLAKKVIEDLMNYGKVQRGFLGVEIQDVDGKLAQEKSLKVNRGILVNRFSENSAAKGAGIEEGDVIVKVDGVSVGSTPELQEQIGRHRPGDKGNVVVNRKGTEKTFMVALRNTQGKYELSKAEKGVFIDKLGAELLPVSKEEREQLKIAGGVKVGAIRSKKLQSVGIAEGFVITKIAKQDVRTVEDAQRILSAKHEGILIEGVNQNGEKAYYGLGLE